MRKYQFVMGEAMHAALKTYAPKVDMRPSQVLRHALVEYWKARRGEAERDALAAVGLPCGVYRTQWNNQTDTAGSSEITTAVALPDGWGK